MESEEVRLMGRHEGSVGSVFGSQSCLRMGWAGRTWEGGKKLVGMLHVAGI